MTIKGTAAELAEAILLACDKWMVVTPYGPDWTSMRDKATGVIESQTIHVKWESS